MYVNRTAFCAALGRRTDARPIKTRNGPRGAVVLVLRHPSPLEQTCRESMR